jgi:phospholipase/carboxylesterase
MASPQFSLHHLHLEPETPVREKHPTVLLIHGLGADENDLAGLAGSLDPRAMFLSVRAPFTLDYGGYKWYDFLEAGKPEPIMFKESCDKLSQFIHDATIHYSINPKALYLLGFSMGTVMSMAMVLSQPHLYRGVIANSGYLAEGTHLEYHWNRLNGTDFFVAHGTFDPLVPVHASRIIREKLEAAHARVEYHEFAMAHEISEESLDAMARWLTNIIDSQDN